MIALHNANCLDILPTIATGSIDAVITDPPYNISTSNKIHRGTGKFSEGGTIDLDFGKWDHGVIHWTDYIDELVRVTTNVGVIAMFYDKYLIGSIALYLKERHNCRPRHIAHYVKRNPAPQARKTQWQQGTESFIIVTRTPL